ncbi:hypothetical protein [Streptomyces sp. NPDC047999]|uniref:hypothetical protein n=1 Tax=Streptomyces sp. NPDC047999 TaxID=3365497 RepID=UPI00371FEC9B
MRVALQVHAPDSSIHSMTLGDFVPEASRTLRVASRVLAVRRDPQAEDTDNRAWRLVAQASSGSFCLA